MCPRDARVSHSAPVLLRENLQLTIRMFANIFSALTSAAAGRGGAGGWARGRAGAAGALQVSYRCGHSVEHRPPEGEQLNNNNSSNNNNSNSSSSESEGAVVSATVFMQLLTEHKMTAAMEVSRTYNIQHTTYNWPTYNLQLTNVFMTEIFGSGYN